VSEQNAELTTEQAGVLTALASGEATLVPDLAVRLGMDQAKVAAAAVLLSQRGLVSIREEPYREWMLKDEGRAALEKGIPERRILAALLEHGGSGSMQEVPGWCGMEPREVGAALKGLQTRGWAVKQGPALQAADPTRGEIPPQPDEVLLQLLSAEGRMTETALREQGCDLDAAEKLLGRRGLFCEVRDRVHRSVSLTPEGEALRAAGLDVKPEVSLLTPDLLASGEWRNVRFKPYDVTLDTEPRHPGKRHPLELVIGDTRRVFLEMGFEEWHSPWVESSFWDFDALFQPQDHPAREMQDTFYVGRPGRTPLPADSAMVDAVAAVHEDGGDTGSDGWQYSWSREKAERNVLRTHNTATTVRALAELGKGPRKVFSVGRVFRRETIDYKHLPIFHQVDGIIIDSQASFSSLLGTLAAFYRAMGFEKFEFRPAFFPYTEPSVEVFIWHAERRDWFEMGGAGIFRPEVTEPLGCTEPVLAWGLGLERLAMLRHGLNDIRSLYLVDLEWLKGVPQCR